MGKTKRKKRTGSPENEVRGNQMSARGQYLRNMEMSTPEWSPPYEPGTRYEFVYWVYDTPANKFDEHSTRSVFVEAYSYAEGAQRARKQFLAWCETHGYFSFMLKACFIEDSNEDPEG